MHRGLWWAVALAPLGCTPSLRWDPQHPAPGGPPAPLARSPAEDELVATSRPTFRWRLPRGEDGAELELCSDPRCRKVLAALPSADTSTTSPIDLPAGVVYWRLRGRAGTRRGASGSPRALVIDTKVGIAGRFVDAIVPTGEEALGKRMVALGDRAVGLYAQLLGVALPSLRSRLYFYPTRQGYDAANRTFAGGRYRHHSGFSGSWGSHIRFVPRSGHAGPELSGDVESTAMHELAHAFENKQVQLFQEQPAWWVEGMANLLSERALSGDAGPAADRVPRLAALFHSLRDLLRRGKAPSLATLLAEDRDAARSDDNDVSTGLYAGAFTLLHYLDSPADPDRQRRFRGLLREVSKLRSFFVIRTIHARLRQLFGELPELERAWLDAVRREPIFPFRAINGELRALAGGGVLLDAPRDQRALAIFAGAVDGVVTEAGPGSRVAATVVVPDGGAQEAALVIGYHTGEFYLVSLHDRGTVGLFHFNRARPQRLERLASARVGPAALSAGSRRELVVDIEAARVVVRLDGGAVLTAPVTAPVRGGWGAATYDGELAFEHLRAEAIPVPDAPAE